MKIRDRKLEELIDYFLRSKRRDERSLEDDTADALKELQQLREERSWQEIKTLKDYPQKKYFQLATMTEVNPMTFWHVDGAVRTFAEDVPGDEEIRLKDLPEIYSRWRPLPMDLPEVE